jgi:hypothetical protein
MRPHLNPGGERKLSRTYSDGQKAFTNSISSIDLKRVLKERGEKTNRDESFGRQAYGTSMAEPICTMLE